MIGREEPKKSLFKLIADLPGSLTDLIRSEIELLKAELIAKAKHVGIGAGLVLGGVVIALGRVVDFAVSDRDPLIFLRGKYVSVPEQIKS